MRATGLFMIGIMLFGCDGGQPQPEPQPPGTDPEGETVIQTEGNKDKALLALHEGRLARHRPRQSRR